jgi:hypothetical protein
MTFGRFFSNIGWAEVIDSFRLKQKDFTYSKICSRHILVLFRERLSGYFFLDIFMAFKGKIAHEPAWITRKEGGFGFSEMVDQLLLK